ILLLPFASFATPLVFFQEYRKQTPFLIRLGSLLIISTILSFGISNKAIFVDHFIAHSLFSFALCGLIFLFIISEEIIFSMLFVVTSGKGGKSNHLHFLILSTIYVGNLTL